MTQARCTDDEFIAAWKETGSVIALKERFGFSSTQSVSHRRKSIEDRYKIVLTSSSDRSSRNAQTRRANGRRIEIEAQDCTILIGSDAHVWPGPLTTAQRAFIHLAGKLKPNYIIANGDVFDGAKVSRHPSGIWQQEQRPNVKAELEACQSFLSKVQAASPQSQRIWTWGNHDARIEYTLSSLVPQYEGVPGFALKDHFPEWQFCMAVFFNDNLVVKHRLASGIHAAYNNAVKSGRSIITGHLHSLKVTPWTDYNGTRYGVDCGTLADTESQQFDYAEEGPSNHRAGFVHVTVRNGKPLMPELCQVWDESSVEFRGELIPV